VTPNVTINISDGPGQHSGAGGTTGAGESGEAPPPVSLEVLQVGASGNAPAPREPGELSTLATAATASGDPPGPMEIDQLQAAAGSLAPEPQPLGAFVGEAGPPAPLAIEELGELGAVPSEPVAPEESGAQTGGRPPRKR
jgi:hypothetical protein